MSQHRTNPESEENAAMTLENQRAVFAAKMIAQHATDEKPQDAVACSALKWRHVRVTRYKCGARVLEFKSVPPGIMKFQTRENGGRTNEYLVNGVHCETLEEAMRVMKQNLECSHGENHKK